MLSSAALQLIALTTMTIDHIGAYLVDFNPLRVIGRIAMPLFVLMLSEGIIYTRSRTKYFGRILVAAVLTELPLWLMHDQLGATLSINILFSFLLCIIAASLIERSWYFVCLLPLFVLLPEVLGVDYGGSTVIMATCYVIAARLFPKEAIARKSVQSAGLVAATVYYVLLTGSSLQWWALLALPLIWLYNGQKGRRLPRYVMYLYYPAHLLVIFLISWLPTVL